MAFMGTVEQQNVEGPKAVVLSWIRKKEISATDVNTSVALPFHLLIPLYPSEDKLSICFYKYIGFYNPYECKNLI